MPLDTGSHIAIFYYMGPDLPLSSIYFSNLFLVFLAFLGNKEVASNLELSYSYTVQVLFGEK